ncbi:hypothetical protein D3C85_1659630 [compost metagenome]
MLIPPAPPPTKIVDTNTAPPVAVVIDVAAAAAIPEILKPADWFRLKPMVWLASAPTWKEPE